MNKENRIKLCFDILNNYEENIKQALMDNDISGENSYEILKHFNFKNDLIFSLNKEYKKGVDFLDFCRENNISEKLPEILGFNNSLYKHQENAIKSILKEKCTIVSTGTGSGKTEAFLIPILDYCIKNKDKIGVKAIIIYPMNALASDQLRRIEEAAENTGITYAILNGETPSEKKMDDKDKGKILSREDIIRMKPDILVTNYVMLERMLTNELYNELFSSSYNVFKYIVLDEIHTYNGNKALHIKFLLHRLRERVSKNVVQIACSATLSRNKDGERTDGYISGDVNKFIESMFNVNEDNYSYIEPVYEKLENTHYIVDDNDYKRIQSSEITKIIKYTLYKGSKNFSELFQILKENKITLSEETLKEHFNEVLRLNEKYPDMPLLDFRIHLFLLKIGDTLRRCSNCGKYYSLRIKKCNDCGHIVLPVYKNDIKLLVGELKDGAIIDPMNNISKKSKDVSEKNLVLLNFNENIKYNDFEHTLNFTIYETGEDYIKLDIEEDGIYQIFKIKDNVPNTIDFDINGPFEYRIIKDNLKGLDKENKKILAFIDNKEKCGRYSTIFSDEFLSDFYYETIKFVGSNSVQNIESIFEETKELLIEKLNIYSEINDDLRKKISNEFECWFRRFIRLHSNDSNNKHVKFILETEVQLSSAEQKISEIALKEAVYFKQNLNKDGQIIRLQKNSFIYAKGMAFRTNKSNNVICISEKGTKYKQDILSLGQDNIKKAIEGLVSKKILEEVLIDDQYSNIDRNLNFPNSIFYLNPKKVNMILEKSEYIEFEEIIRENLFLAGAHSSEVDKDKRKENEDKFQQGEINLLIATPTLEMGIDIGNLSFVYMLGVPPVPSNYAQRAGRAGRRGDRFAGIITICSEISSHDWYYFYNPKEIIEGLINPPKFNVNNKKVLNKHVNTIIYPKKKAGFGHNGIVNLENRCEDIFDCIIDIDDHIKMLNDKLYKSKDINGDEYKKGLYPEYIFSRQDVQMLIEIEKKSGREKDKYDVLATREPELAYKQINMGKSMFIGERYYDIVPEDNKNTFKSVNGCEIIDIWKLKCIDNEENINRDKDRIMKKYYINIELDNENLRRKIKGPISIFLKNDMDMEFIAEYKNKAENEYFGYQICKDAIIFEFDKTVINEKQYVSFMSLLHKIIKIEFGLDNGEMGLIIESDKEEIRLNRKDKELEEENKIHAILYDKNGNKNIDMEVVLEGITQTKDNILQKAYKLVADCNCIKESGCYLCMKSYETQWVYDKLNKYSAKNMVGYLSGKEKLNPGISLRKKNVNYETEINLRRKSDFILKVNNNKEEVLENKEYENETIMHGLYIKIKDIYINDDVETILITSNLDRIINGINGKCNLNDCGESLHLFDFYRQAYKKFDAELVKK